MKPHRHFVVFFAVVAMAAAASATTPFNPMQDPDTKEKSENVDANVKLKSKNVSQTLEAYRNSIDETKSFKERERDAREAYCRTHSTSPDCLDQATTGNDLTCPAGQRLAHDEAGVASCAPLPMDRIERPGDTPTPDDNNGQIQAASCSNLAKASQASCGAALSRVEASSAQVATLNKNLSKQTNVSPASCGQMGQSFTQSYNEMVAQKASCEQTVHRCQSTCASAVANTTAPTPGSASLSGVRAREGQTICSQSANIVARMNVAISQTQAAAYQANRCYSEVTGTPMDDSPTGGGSSMPSMSQDANDGVNCSKPEIATTNPICICRFNPGNAACGGASSMGALGVGGTSNAGSQNEASARKDAFENSAAENSGLNLSGPATTTYDDENTLKPTPRGQALPQQAGGRGAGVNAQTAAAANANRSSNLDRNQNSRYNSNVNGGVYTGSIQGGVPGRGGYANGSEGSWQGGAGTRATARGQTQKGIDVRQFLPNGQRRPTNDGRGSIGGIHTNIFNTVRNRYARDTNLTP